MLLKPLLHILIRRHVRKLARCAVLDHVETGALDAVADMAAATDVNPGALVPQLVDVLAVVREAVLDVLAAARLVRGARVGVADLDGAELLPSGKLVGVQVVSFGVAAAKEEQSGCHLAAGANHGGALLDEAAEGSQSCSGREADDGCVFGVGGEMEGCGRADGHVQLVAGAEGGEEARGNTDVVTLAGEGGLVEDGVRQGELCWVG